MEATIQSNNQAINIDINVSINVDALRANIQRGLQDTKQRVLQATNQGVLMASKKATKLYRNVSAAVRTIDVGNVLSNLWIGGWSIAGIYLIYMYA